MRWVVLLCFTAMSANCHTGAAPMASSQPTQKYRDYSKGLAVEVGDTLIINVFGEKDLTGKYQVSGAGTIDFPLVGRMKVKGLTSPEVASWLRRKLADGFLRNPHVSVFTEGFLSRRKIYVWGEVREAGNFDYRSGMTVIEAITLAGGMTQMASKGGVTVTRRIDGQHRTIQVPMGKGESANYALAPGDVVYVPERAF